MRLATLALSLIVAVPTAARAQCDTSAARRIELAGQVVDARALVPLRATVLFTSGRDTLASLTADSSGSFLATLCARSGVTAHFRRLGYRADSLVVPIERDRQAMLDVAMTPLDDSPAVTLAESRILADRSVSAAEKRVHRAGGSYIGEEEIQRLNPARLADLLRGRRGVTLEDAGGTLRVVSSRGIRPNISDGGARVATRPPPPTTTTTTGATPVTGSATDEPAHMATGGAESCALRIGVNGHLMPEEYRLDELSVSDVVAIELYSSVATIPVEFSSTRRTMNCGLVMIWTRDGMSTP